MIKLSYTFPLSCDQSNCPTEDRIYFWHIPLFETSGYATTASVPHIETAIQIYQKLTEEVAHYLLL